MYLSFQALPKHPRLTATLAALGLFGSGLAWAQTPSECRDLLSFSSLSALQGTQDPVIRGIQTAEAYLKGRIWLNQALAREAFGRPLTAQDRAQLSQAPATWRQAMKLLIQNGATLDRNERLTLANFQFEKLRPGVSSEVSQAFTKLYPSAFGQIVRILNPKRSEVLFLEGQALLPPTLKTTLPGQKFTAAMPIEDYQKYLAQEFSGLETDLREFLAASARGGGFQEFIEEISAFYTNDIWGLSTWDRPFEARQAGAQDQIQVRLQRLKSKWGLGRSELGQVLSTVARVQAQGTRNREQALDEFYSKAVAVALAPALVPVAAVGLLPTFMIGAGISALDAAGSALAESQIRGGNFPCLLLRQIDQKLPHGFSMSLLFSPLGALGKAAQATSPLLRTGARAGIVAVTGAGGVTAKTSIDAAMEAQKNEAAAIRSSGAKSELSKAASSEKVQAISRAVTDSTFAVLGAKEFFAPRKPPAKATPSQGKPAAPRTTRAATPVDALPAQNPEQIVRRSALETNLIDDWVLYSKHIAKLNPLSASEAASLTSRLVQTSRQVLESKGTVLLPALPEDPLTLAIRPTRTGSGLNEIAWKIHHEYGTLLVFRPIQLLNERVGAFYNRDLNQVCLSVGEVLEGKRLLDLKHELIHLVRTETPDLPLSGKIHYGVETADDSVAYGRYMSLQELITHTWDLSGLAAKLRRGLKSAAPSDFSRKLGMVEHVSKKGVQALELALSVLKTDPSRIVLSDLATFHLSGFGTFQLPLPRSLLSRFPPNLPLSDFQRGRILSEIRILIERDLQLAKVLLLRAETIRQLRDRTSGSLEEPTLDAAIRSRKVITEADSLALKESEAQRVRLLDLAHQTSTSLQETVQAKIDQNLPLTFSEHERLLTALARQKDYAQSIFEVYGEKPQIKQLNRAEGDAYRALSAWVEKSHHPEWLELARKREAHGEELFRAVMNAVTQKDATKAKRLALELSRWIDGIWDVLYAVGEPEAIEAFSRTHEYWNKIIVRLVGESL